MASKRVRRVKRSNKPYMDRVSDDLALIYAAMVLEGDTQFWTV